MLLFILLLGFPSLYAQPDPPIQWDNTIGGTDNDELTSLQQTRDGGYILGGISFSGIGGDKTQDNRGNSDYWVVKLDAAGKKVWDRRFGGSEHDNLETVQQTWDGGYILGGTSFSNSGGDKTENRRGEEDYWVVKLDKHGNKQWDRTFGGGDEDRLFDLEQTKDGGYILGGRSFSGADGDKSQPSFGQEDYWVVKLDKHGNKVWDRTYGGEDSEDLQDLQQTKDGGYILGGSSNSGASGNKTAVGFGDHDYWVVKLDKHGSKEWDKSFGGDGIDRLNSLQQTHDGGYILGGNSSSPPNTGNKTAGLVCPDQDFVTSFAWVLKLDKAGSKQWEQIYGDCVSEEGSSNDALHVIVQTREGGYLFGGRTDAGACDQGGCRDAFWLVKLDALGNQKWEKTINGEYFDVLTDLEQTRDKGFIVGGRSNSPAGEDKTEPNVGPCASGQDDFPSCTFDFWVVKLAPEAQQVQQVKSFTLINTQTEQPIRTLQEGDEINLAELATKKLNIRADTDPAVVGSVKFNLSGKQKRTQIENEAPYALFGDSKGDYNKWTPTPGSYTLKATPYAERNARGKAGIPLTIHFTVIHKKVKPRVESFTLVYSRTGQVIQTLKDGEVVNLADLASHNVNVVAHTLPAQVGSVRFRLSGKVSKTAVENEAPYALYGDFGGRYKDWYLQPGSYQLSATAYTHADAKGASGDALTVSFRVVNEPAARLAHQGQAARPELATPRLYPNPTPDGRLQVQLPEPVQGQLRYSLLSSLGQKLAEGSLELSQAGNLLELDFSGQLRSAGVYYLKLEGSGLQQVFRIMRR